MRLTETQKEQVKAQLKRHERPDGFYDIQLAPDAALTGLRISRGVFASDFMSSGLHMSKFLIAKPQLYRGKFALDMGCGAGILGIAMAIGGASLVDMADISELAVNDARFNSTNLGFDNVRVFQSDLFSALPLSNYDFIVFNHPFFPEVPEEFDNNFNDLLKCSMLGGEELLPRFFQDAKKHLHPEGLIVMPYFHLAGEQNNPKLRGQEAGYRIIAEQRFSSAVGAQRGDFSIYSLQLPD